jgi:hypothetical protein
MLPAQQVVHVRLGQQRDPMPDVFSSEPRAGDGQQGRRGSHGNIVNGDTFECHDLIRMSATEHDDRPPRATITRRDAVELLFGLRAGRMLAPFLEREQTLTTAATLLRVPPTTMAYWLPMFLSCGLLDPPRIDRS